MSDLDLLVARMKAAGALRVFKIGAVPATPGDAYAVLGLDTGTPVNRREGGSAPRLIRRLSVQCFGRSIDAAEDMAQYADAAFYDQSLDELEDEPFSVRELQIGPTRDPDTGGVLYILHTYRF